jgi:phospholipase C
MRKIRFAIAIALFGAAVACSSTISTPTSRAPGTGPTSAPAPAIKHVVILFQENRSMNTMFMGFPGADTATSGPCIPWTPPKRWHMKEICPNGGTVKLTEVPLESKKPGLGGVDIMHEHAQYLSEGDKDPMSGVLRMDGFDTDYLGTTGLGGPAGFYPYSFVKRSELKPYWDMASQYTLADRMFSTETSDSFPAHQMIIAGTTALSPTESLMNEPQNSLIWGCDAAPGTVTGVIYKNGKYVPNAVFPCFDQYKTMADSLDAANVSWRYYVENWNAEGKYSDFSGGTWDAFDAIKPVRYGPDWKNIIMPNSTVLTDAAKGTLPSVSWVIPKLTDSDHPASGCRNGPTWVSRVVDAIGNGPDWDSTAIVITWDEWGGWYDSIPPPQLDYVSLGMRIPMIIISPYAKHHYVSKTQYEFGSILKFIEQNFGAPSLGATDVRANSISGAFDFTQKPAAFKPFTIPKPMVCKQASAEAVEKASGGIPE